VALRRSVRYAGLAVAALALILGAAVGWLKLHEDELVFATAHSKLVPLPHPPDDAEPVSIPVGTGTALAGLVYVAPPPLDTGYFILQLHGNADSAFSAEQVRHCEALRQAGFSVLDIDYRGFGLSPGTPSEARMYEDAEAAFEAILRRGLPEQRIILLGHSLGSGPAVYLATRHAAAALVLFGAFTSIPDAAADRYPLLPVRYAASVRFDSIARLPSVHAPVIVAHSRADTVIPYSHALRLYAAANQPKRLLTFDVPAKDGFGGHVDTLFEHVAELKSQLEELLPRASAAPGG
jgi:fermentation-respiration switch protein FrsA (DUF1100 family)